MKKFLFAALMGMFIFAQTGSAQPQSGQDVFVPISKYLESGQYDNLAAWFADNLELDVLGNVNNCSKNQAKLIMKTFIDEYTPKKFIIFHKSGKAPMKYAIGSLQAGGETFRVTIFVRTSENGKNYIQQLRIEND
ncbi:MAG: DUF4783 domain-containing protein [Bacteroidales bacterium]|jgi:hypothetical protein|nr:DUF4783 domain-containing protein [Bacteroidales bacterium]MCI2145440.1 DUF4783 domain-containing protein [Bacteroidales bacterium]